MEVIKLQYTIDGSGLINSNTANVTTSSFAELQSAYPDITTQLDEMYYGDVTEPEESLHFNETYTGSPTYSMASTYTTEDLNNDLLRRKETLEDSEEDLTISLTGLYAYLQENGAVANTLITCNNFIYACANLNSVSANSTQYTLKSTIYSDGLNSNVDAVNYSTDQVSKCFSSWCIWKKNYNSFKEYEMIINNTSEISI